MKKKYNLTLSHFYYILTGNHLQEKNRKVFPPIFRQKPKDFTDKQRAGRRRGGAFRINGMLESSVLWHPFFSVSCVMTLTLRFFHEKDR